MAKDYCAVGLLRHDNVVTDYAFAGVGCAGCEGESGVVERQAVHMADVESVGWSLDQPPGFRGNGLAVVFERLVGVVD